jgi:hypothetical protein
VLRRLVRVQTPAAAGEIASQLNTICPGVGFGNSGQLVTGQREEKSTNNSCDCVCDVVGDLTRTYNIMLGSAKASFQSVTLADRSTRLIPDTSLSPATVIGTDPFIETYDAAGSDIEFGFFQPSGGASWYSPWRILAHELCGHGRLGQSQSGMPGNRPGHDPTIDTENQIAAEHGEPARGHWGDTRQGESFNPIGNRTKIAFRLWDGWHYEAP